MDFKELTAAIKSMTKTADDQTAAKALDLYPDWVEGFELTQEMIDKGRNRFKCDGKLHKTDTPHVFRENWRPGQETASVWTVIDVEHEGTLADPIPYSVNMIVYQDKYYTYEGVLYICTRDSGIALQHTPTELIGHYFKLA